MTRGDRSLAEELAYYAQLPYAATISTYECDGQLFYIATHPQLYGCVGAGRTPTEARCNLDAARPAYLAELCELGVDIPVPTGATWAFSRPRTA